MRSSPGSGSAPAPAIRLTRRDILLLLTFGLLVHFLLPRVGEVRTAVADLLHANPFGVLGSLLAAAGAVLCSAWTLRLAAANRFPLRPAVTVQLAAAFANLAPGNVGGIALTVRYLRHQGFPVAAAATIVAVTRVAGLVSVILLLPVLLVFAHRPSPHLPTPTRSLATLLAVVGAMLLAAVALGVPKLRAKSRTVLRQVVDSLRSLVKGGRAGRLISACLALTVAYGACLYLALLSVGLPIDPSLIPRVMLLTIVGEGIGSVVPTPGGLGATEAALVSGLLIYGVPAETAVAGVLIYRFATFWLPLAPGFVALRTLTKRGDI